ncbi:hypothetical protein BH11ARM1_BH11ARM1_01720 [soil metagenome]
MIFPTPVPEIPVASLKEATAYYIDHLGFTLDWGDEEGGIAGISRGNCRLFLTDLPFREGRANRGPVVVWLNFESNAEVDELFTEWKSTGATITSEPEDKPWKLHEFSAEDLDGNRFRVFHDFSQEV